MNDIYSNIAGAKSSGDLLSALTRAASGKTSKEIVMREEIREAAAIKKYSLHTESLADSTVEEVVAEFNGQIVFHRNGNWFIKLSVASAIEINARYNWELTEI